MSSTPDMKILPSFKPYVLTVYVIETLQNQRKGKASTLLKALAGLATKYGFLGAMLHQACSPPGKQLLRHMIGGLKWLGNGRTPAKVKHVKRLIWDFVTEVPNEERNTEFDERTDFTKIDSVKDLIPRIDDFCSIVAKCRPGKVPTIYWNIGKYIIGGDVLVELGWRWRRTNEQITRDCKVNNERAFDATNAYSPISDELDKQLCDFYATLRESRNKSLFF